MLRPRMIAIIWLTCLPAGPAPGAIAPAGEGRLPPVVQSEIDRMRISQTPMVALVREVNAVGAAVYRDSDPAVRAHARKAKAQAVRAVLRETASRAVLRALHSDAPLRERMTWFWFNHFNVYSGKRDIAAMVPDYEDGLRTRALGRFRDLLGMTVIHPAMLRYLDNDLNVAGRINENYARELMELHTLGVDGGYSQQDVVQLAHILTGLGVRIDERIAPIPPRLKAYHVRKGLFEFDPRKHDFGDRILLGQKIAGGGLDEIDRALDLLARSPATARHISRRISAYFLGVPPPPSLVERMAAAWRRSDGRIAAVLEAMMAAEEYKTAANRGLKDPIDYVLSAARLKAQGGPILNAETLVDWITRLGEGLYDRHTPDGYPLTGDNWMNPGQMAMRFEIARTISRDDFGLPDGPMTQQWEHGALPFRLQPRTAAAVKAAGSPNQRWLLILSSPEFMRR
ncbi:DUF1800 domain-containing protein [Sphingobium sp. CAP-1]|uniref:DUF1800 domain-containing protein n=1 Tax=Sphingobium sp. CAP-1 TaxID=2676077 RepID=UPI0012BB1F20|nr:DUF1800 domain-containing protein [Sphingobium sp. CAP-1]QGP79584.1 DUF1800 family protein [Sphingobium sp. CAP-1]